jgi:hypothetical protein
MSRLHAIQPTSVQRWDEFVASATACDATGFPLSGSFGIGYNCHVDLSTATLADIARSVEEGNPTDTANQVRIASGILRDAYAALQPNTLVALKKGLKIIAFARIVGPYRFDASHVDAKDTHPHRWNYEVVRKATAAEEDSHTGNFRLTFVADSVPMPADLVPAPATGGAGTSAPILEVTDRDDTEEEYDHLTEDELRRVKKELKKKLERADAALARSVASRKADEAARAAAKAAKKTAAAKA